MHTTVRFSPSRAGFQPAIKRLAYPRLPLLFAFALSALATLPSAALANTVSLSGSMEGNIAIRNGDWVAAGYSFTMPGAHPAALVSVGGLVTITGTCSNGSSERTILIPLETSLLGVPAGSSAWFPIGNESSPASYQGAVTTVVCGGEGALNASGGATLTAEARSADTTDPIHLRFHYRDPSAKGKENVDCATTVTSSDVCGASWSGTTSTTASPLEGGAPAS